MLVVVRGGLPIQTATEPEDTSEGAIVDRSSILRTSTMQLQPALCGLFLCRHILLVS